MTEPIAVFQYVNGKQIGLKRIMGNKLYIGDYNGIFPWGLIRACNPISLSLLQDGIRADKIRVTKSPDGSFYDVWHVCMCPECVQNRGVGIFSDSQRDWDEHLRHVPNDKVFTFPTAGK